MKPTVAAQRTIQNFGLLGGGGQVPLRAAIRLSLGRALASPNALWHSLAWGVGVGIFNALPATPMQRPMLLLGSLLVALAVGYLGPVPWRWRLVRGRSRWRLLANAVVACVFGYTLFFLGFLFAGAVFYGAEVFDSEALGRLSLVGIGGFIYAILGLYITTGHDEQRARLRLEREARRQQELLQRAHEIVLRSQINPHFFFNALNTIAALIPSRPADAEGAVEFLAEALRPALMRDQPLTATLRREVEIARAYGELELLRLGDRLTIDWELDPSAMDLEMPSLSLQPLLENGVRHGVTPHPGKHRITIQAVRSGDGLELRVLNAPEEAHGPLSVEAAFRQGHALHNVRQRLRARFGLDATLAVHCSADGRAATATLRVPGR